MKVWEWLIRLVTRLGLLVGVWLLTISLLFTVPFLHAPFSQHGIPAVARAPDQPQARLSSYLGGVLQGDLGLTLRDEPVPSALRRMSEPSLTILILSLTFGLVLGGASTFFSRLLHPVTRRIWDSWLSVGLAVPESILVAFVWLVGITLLTKWNYKPFPLLWIAEPQWRHYALPVGVMSIYPAVTFGRAVGTLLDDLERTTFWQAARAKGLSPPQLLLGHAVKHGCYRVAVVLPSLAAWMLSVLIAVEWVFFIPGIGRALGLVLWFRALDPNLVAGLVTILMVWIAAVHLGAGLLAAWADPRREAA